MSKKCLICGRSDWQHHEFSAPEEGCICAVGSWDGSDEVRPVCKLFESYAFDVNLCKKCEHDKGCHK